MHFDTKRILALAVAGGAVGGMARVGSAQIYDAVNGTSFVYLSSNPPDGSVANPGGTLSQLVPMAINDSGTIAGYYRAYQWSGSATGYGYSTGIVLTTSSVVAAAGTTVTSFAQITGASSPDGNPQDLPSSNGYGSGNGNDNYGTGINASGTVADTNMYSSGSWASTAVPSAYTSPVQTYVSTVPITAQSASAGSNGTFGGGNFGSGLAAPSGLGTGIDNAADVVGAAYAYAANANNKILHALIASPTPGVDPIDLNQYVSGANGSVAYAIDPNTSLAAGNAFVVGVSTPNNAKAGTIAPTQKSATVWTYNGTTWTAQLLPSPYTLANPSTNNTTSEGQSIAYGVANVSGGEVVVGVSDSASGYPVATKWINGTPYTLEAATGSHQSRTYAPYSNPFYNTTASHDPNIKDYFSSTPVQSVADAINSSGDIVGYSTAVPIVGAPAQVNVTETAVLWTPTGQEINLNSYLPAGYQGYLEEATGINSSGQIVGWGIDANSEIFGFELNPIAIAVPEPTGLIFIAAVAGLLGRRRRSTGVWSPMA